MADNKTDRQKKTDQLTLKGNLLLGRARDLLGDERDFWAVGRLIEEAV